MQIASSEEITRLERNVPWLAITGAVTPFIGLFGTVWGIIDAFHGLGTAGAATLRAVAPGISEALITTAAGLAAAIPAVIAYNLIIGSIRELAARNDDFALEMLNLVERQQDSSRTRNPPRGSPLMAFTTANGRTQTALADINITPLVDVVLVLLIIFMVTAPILQSGIEVNVPHTRTVKEITEERLVISIDKSAASLSRQRSHQYQSDWSDAQAEDSRSAASGYLSALRRRRSLWGLRHRDGRS